MNHTELLMRRRAVWAFIVADKFPLVITRKTEPIKNPLTGGYQPGVDTTVYGPQGKPQVARIVQNVRRYWDGIINSEAGDIPHSDYRLVGPYYLNLEVDDQFKWLGETYRVTGIHEARQESIFAAISLLGADNRGS